MARKRIAILLGLAVGLALVAALAAAKPAPVTKIKFKLDAHELATGTDVTGSVNVFTRTDHLWAPFPAATLSLRVDGVEVATLTTDVDGHADIVYTGALEGDHVMKVFFIGDDLHKRAQRAQGFSVTGSVTPVATAPEAPALTGASAATATVSLTWTVPPDGGSAITGYNVYRGDTAGTETLLIGLGVQNTYDDTTVLTGSTHYYVVTAVNALGESVVSNEVSVTAL
jgi:hypothetical protein